MSYLNEFTKGFWKENPVLRVLLGFCPTMAVSTTAINGVGMGMAATFVLVFSNIFISLLRNIIPNKVRIPCFIVVICSFVTIVDLVMKGFFYDLHKELGLFIPLIVVNCIILGRAEAFASKNGVFASMIDGLGMGLGFTVTLIILGIWREFLGSGTFFGGTRFVTTVPGISSNPILIMVMPPGAFVSMGFMVGIMNRLSKK